MKLDMNALETYATAHPSRTIELAGQVEADARARLDELRTLANRLGRSLLVDDGDRRVALSPVGERVGSHRMSTAGGVTLVN